jgi:hypothetical protein
MKRIVPRGCDTGQCLPCRLLAGAVGWAARCPAIMKARSGPGGRRLCLLSSARGLALPAKVNFASSPSPSIAPPNSLSTAGRQNSADLSARFTRSARSARCGDSLRALWPPAGEGPERFRCLCCQEPSHRSADRCSRSTDSGAEHLMIWPRSPDTTCHSLSGHRIPKSGVVVCQCALRSGGQGRPEALAGGKPPIVAPSASRLPGSLGTIRVLQLDFRSGLNEGQKFLVQSRRELLPAFRRDLDGHAVGHDSHTELRTVIGR